MSHDFSHPTCVTAYAPFTPSESGQRSPPTYHRGCWHVVSRGFLVRYRHRVMHPASFLTTEVYNPKAFIPHAASLDQAFAHCPIFPTAASRRSPGRISVPVCLVALSRQIPVEALVGHYPANKLIGREPLSERRNICRPGDAPLPGHRVLALVSQRYPRLRGRLLTCYSPVRRSVTREQAPSSDRSTCMY